MKEENKSYIEDGAVPMIISHTDKRSIPMLCVISLPFRVHWEKPFPRLPQLSIYDTYLSDWVTIMLCY